MVTVPEENPGEVIGEGIGYLQRLAFLKCQHHGMAIKEQQQLWRGHTSSSLGDKLCAAEAELEKWLRPSGAQRIVGESQISDTKLFILLNCGLALV